MFYSMVKSSFFFCENGYFCFIPALISAFIIQPNISIKSYQPFALNLSQTTMAFATPTHQATLPRKLSKDIFLPSPTFSIRSIHGCRYNPKSMKVHSMPSRLYSSCSRMNMVWLKSSLPHPPLYCSTHLPFQSNRCMAADPIRNQ